MTKETIWYPAKDERLLIKSLLRRSARQIYPLLLMRGWVKEGEECIPHPIFEGYLRRIAAAAQIPTSYKLYTEDYRHLFHSTRKICHYYQTMESGKKEMEWFVQFLERALMEFFYFSGCMGYRQFCYQVEKWCYLAVDLHRLEWNSQYMPDKIGISVGNRQPCWRGDKLMRQKGENYYILWNYKKRAPKPMPLILYREEKERTYTYPCVIFDASESSYAEFYAELRGESGGLDGKIFGAYRFLGQEEYRKEKMLQKAWKGRERFFYYHILTEEFCSILIHGLLYEADKKMKSGKQIEM